MRRVLLVSVMIAGLWARGEKAELFWTFPDGSEKCETVSLDATGNVFSLTLTKDFIRSRGACALRVIPEFACARKGEAGYWFSPYGYYGEWDCDNGAYDPPESERMNMQMFGWSTPRGAYLAIVTGMPYYGCMKVEVRQGDYRLSYSIGPELCARPYADFKMEFRAFPAGTGYSALCAEYRRYQLDRGAVRPLKERVKGNPILKQAVESPEIRIRQAWKPVPSPVPYQTPSNEPPVKAVVTFDRVKDIVTALKSNGVEKAELCLVGWNIGGHDGRWPQAFPAEPKLGGDDKLKETIAMAKSAGYLIVPHGNFRDAYTIADSWNEEWTLKYADGKLHPDREGKYTWGGGMPFVICPRRAYELFATRDMPKMAEYGFRGLGYFDVVSILLAPECHDPRHPCSFADSVRYWGLSAEISKRCFGGFASEGAVDHFAGSLDSVLYASFDLPDKIEDDYRAGRGIAKGHRPIFQLVYNGIIVQNPFTSTVNFTAQSKYWQLKLLEYGGRPNFYFYSKFKHDGGNWMGDGDLACGTDEELAWSVAKIAEGAALYARLNRLQYEFMTDHEALSDGVFRTTWSDGTSIVVDYRDKSFRVVGK